MTDKRQNKNTSINLILCTSWETTQHPGVTFLQSQLEGHLSYPRYSGAPALRSSPVQGFQRQLPLLLPAWVAHVPQWVTQGGRHSAYWSLVVDLVLDDVLSVWWIRRLNVHKHDKNYVNWQKDFLGNLNEINFTLTHILSNNIEGQDLLPIL